MLDLKLKPPKFPEGYFEHKADDGVIYIPIELVNNFITNPLGALRDFACIPTNAITPFFTDVDKLDACSIFPNPFDSATRTFDTDFTCKDDYFRYMHVDLAYKKDGIGIAMCHVPYWTTVERVKEDEQTKIALIEKVQQPFIKFDFTGRILASGNTEILISTALDLILELVEKRGFYIHLITFDRFESMQTMQTLRERNFNVGHLSIDRTSHKLVVDYEKDDNIDRQTTDKQYNAAMECVRYAIQEERIEICEHSDWYQETRGLEFIPEKNKVVKSPHSSDDLIQAIAGAAFNASNNELPDGLVETELPTEAKDTKYEDFYRQQYADDNVTRPEDKFSNYSVGVA